MSPAPPALLLFSAGPPPPPLAPPPETCPTARLETSAKSCQGPSMDWDDLKPNPSKGVTVGEDLRSLSQAELEARIAVLNEEIERVKTELGAKKRHEEAAASIFK